MNDWTKAEYAGMHWEGIKNFIRELDADDHWSDRDKLFQLIGYLEGYAETDKELER